MQTYINEQQNYSLKEVLNEKKLLKLFEKHCIKEQSQENLIFLKKVLEYKDLEFSKRSERNRKANYILTTFLQSNSQQELNCNKKEIQKVQEAIENLELDDKLFDSISKEVEENLKDTLLRFFSSEEFINYQKKNDNRRSNSMNGSLQKDEGKDPIEFLRQTSLVRSNSLDSKTFSWKNLQEKFKISPKRTSFLDQTDKISLNDERMSLLSESEENGDYF